MVAMSLTEAAVARARAAWVWVPDDAVVVESDEYTILRLPDWFDYPLSVLSIEPSGPDRLGPAVDAVLGRARSFGPLELQWQVKLADPAGLDAELTARGAKVDVTLDVLASDLSRGAPPLPPPTADVTIRWATDVATARDGAAVQVAGFGGAVPPDDRLERSAAKDADAVPAGEGGLLVAYVDGKAAGAGGLALVDGVARLWGGVVVPAARGTGIYRAVLSARMAYAVAHGATMALVKGKVDTSGPILRRAGFDVFGQETVYRISL
jgi:GNAT superfamily N-acetyltransferase